MFTWKVELKGVSLLEESSGLVRTLFDSAIPMEKLCALLEAQGLYVEAINTGSVTPKPHEVQSRLAIETAVRHLREAINDKTKSNHRDRKQKSTKNKGARTRKTNGNRFGGTGTTE